MPNLTLCRWPSDAPLEPAQHLIAEVFTAVVAPTFSAEGARVFADYTTLPVLQARRLHGAVWYVAQEGEVLQGALEMRARNHLSLLFVAVAAQHRGIAQGLFDLARADHAGEITVNASPNAVGFYRRMGFAATAQEQQRCGIRFIPMRLTP